MQKEINSRKKQCRQLGRLYLCAFKNGLNWALHPELMGAARAEQLVKAAVKL